ncbi:MAG: SDR family oxidoreductase [Armatimonadota bacterium]|nr:MAG: SDR family oxidoreductase [Armatimonadota bacterium]
MSGGAEGGPGRPAYLVTGGAGFIGSHLVEALVKRGERVRVLDDFSAGRRENLAGAAGRVEVLEGDIKDVEACRRACEGVGYVLHHAARVSVEESLADPVGCHEVNALGTLKMLCAAREAGCKRFVYAGSASVYGDTATIPHREDMAERPLSPYAVAKHVGELYCRAFFDLYELDTVVLRYFNVFGPRQDASSPYSGVIAKFVGDLLQGKGITVYGDGEQSRDFVAVENVVNANLLACTAAEAPGKVMNIGCGERMSVNRLGEELRELTGVSCEVGHGAARSGEVRHSQADIRRAREVLGYEVAVPVMEGLRRTVGWYRKVGAGGGR